MGDQLQPLSAATAQAWPALGTVLSYSTDGGTTYVPLGQVTNIGAAGGGEVGERDTTTLGSTAHTNAPTIPDNGEVTFSINLDPTNTGHALLFTWKETPLATTPSWKVAFATTPVWISKFTAWLKSIDGANAEGVDDNLVCDITLRISGNCILSVGP